MSSQKKHGKDRISPEKVTINEKCHLKTASNSEFHQRRKTDNGKLRMVPYTEVATLEPFDSVT